MRRGFCPVLFYPTVAIQWFEIFNGRQAAEVEMPDGSIRNIERIQEPNLFAHGPRSPGDTRHFPSYLGQSYYVLKTPVSGLTVVESRYETFDDLLRIGLGLTKQI